MPEDSATAMPRSSLAATHRRQPPPAPPSPGQRSGPPSIGLDDSPHNEFDLGSGGAPSLELDYGGGPGQRPMAEPPPGISAGDSGMDFPAPVTRNDPSEVDLPGPVGISVRDGGADAYSLDLPTPVGDDLPRPVGARPPGPSRPPAPSRRPGSSRSPAAGPPAAGPPPAGLPSFGDDLPVPVDLDLPTPVAGPQLDDGLDLPMPGDLPAVGGQQMVAPANLSVTPAELGVEPANLNVTPAELGVEPADLNVTPAERGAEPANPSMTPRAASASHPSGSASELPPPVGSAMGSAARSPSPSQVASSSRPPVSRGLLVGVGVIAVVGLAGVGLLYSGILDPVDPELVTQRGNLRSSPEAKGGATQDPGEPAAPGGPAAERTPAVLASMATHTPAGYLEARAAATAAGDGVGAAECALLLHYHYGPNPALATEARASLQAYTGNPAEFVQRVLALSALAAGDLEAAETGLGGDALRARLYRGWLRLAQGSLDQAKTEADAVLAALPDEVGARHLALAVEATRDPVAAVPLVLAAVAKNSHPALQALLASTATETGQLAIARTAVDALDPGATEDPGVQAWTHAQQARVRAAQGDYAEALAGFDRALALVPQAPAVQVDRIRTLLAAKRFNDASAAISALVRERTDDHALKLLQAEVAVQSGDGDIALQILEQLATALPEDARVKRLEGEVHAMRLEVEPGQAAFAAARALDPRDHRIAIGEAILLADAKRLPDALAVLTAARTEAEGAGRNDAVARLLVTKARLHEKAGELDAAVEAAGRALEAAPGDNEAQLLRGTLRLRLGQAAAGRTDLVEVFERTGGYPGLAVPLGRLYVSEGDYESLERLVGDRLRGEDTDDELLLIGARLRLQQGRIEDAGALLKTALVRRPSDWEAHMLRAQLLIVEGKPAEALAEIELAHPPNPQPELMLQRGKILEFNGRHDDALPEYRHALELDPDLHEARFLFGRLVHHKGGHGKAITELRKVVDAPAAKTASWFPEVWLNIGLAQQAQGKYADAIESLRRATTIDPTLGEAWAKMGTFHENLNKHGEAIAALTKAVELGDPGDHWYADALMNLGRAQAKAGRKATAKKTLEKFLEVASPESTSRAEAERLIGSL